VGACLEGKESTLLMRQCSCSCYSPFRVGKVPRQNAHGAVPVLLYSSESASLSPHASEGRDNAVADHLSRNAFQSFLQQPTLLPEPLMQALVVHRSDCASQAWRDVLRSISPMVWPVHPREHTSSEKTGKVLLHVRIVTSTIDRVGALLICVLPSGSVFAASHYKDVYVRSKILADKVGLWRPIHCRYATSRLRDEGNKEGASNFGERC
jgi:hypothetical protein